MINPVFPLQLTEAELNLCLKVATQSTRDEVFYAIDTGSECNLWECEWVQMSDKLRAHADKKGTQKKEEMRQLAQRIEQEIKRR